MDFDLRAPPSLLFFCMCACSPCLVWCAFGFCRLSRLAPPRVAINAKGLVVRVEGEGPFSLLLPPLTWMRPLLNAARIAQRQQHHLPLLLRQQQGFVSHLLAKRYNSSDTFERSPPIWGSKKFGAKEERRRKVFLQQEFARMDPEVEALLAPMRYGIRQLKCRSRGNRDVPFLLFLI